jgi:hypothetical protein
MTEIAAPHLQIFAADGPDRFLGIWLEIIF